MASPQEFRVSRATPFPHLHCPHCPLRRHCHHCPLHTHHFPPPPQYLPPLPHNPHLFAPSLLPTSHAIQYHQEPKASVAHSQELEHVELDDEEEDDEPVFVLTDEWREFFAKSEARRKQEKKQGEKGKK
ncbi:hypothetical protein PIB30_085005 [Stylosanthes scabra]|uniref:Uncharacterized protein n=1 Tax=Stylosanthes scabra TaxID=79078 RepID=A0ABU6QT85_9FABA|nr:hypothetical protein [Stylosanthes scabra]